MLEHVTINPPSQRNTTEVWQKEDAKAMFILANNVNDEIIGSISECTTARDMFLTICGTFDREKELKQVDLRDKLFSMRFDPRKDKLNEFFVNFKVTATQLRSLGDQTPICQFVLRMLRSLPSDYRPIKTVLENQSTVEDGRK